MCGELDLVNGPFYGFIRADVISVTIPREHSEHVGAAGGEIAAIKMPRYVCTVATSVAFPPDVIAI
jgi:hypothetical protein